MSGAPRRPGIGVLVALAAMVAADQASKAWLVRTLGPHDQLTLIPGWLNFIHVHNPGVVFGLAGSGPLRLVMTLALPLLLVPLLVWLLWTGESKLERAAYALILGGAIGNLIDRVRLGHVIDFIDAYWRRAPGVEHHWYAFNLADSFICVGGGLLAIAWFVVKPKEETAAG